MKKIEIEIPDGKRAEWVDGAITPVDEKHYGIIIGSKYYAYVKLENVYSMCKHCDLAELCPKNEIETQICTTLFENIPFKDNRYMCFKYVGDIDEIKLKESKPKDVTERIKTFEDACKELNKMNSLMPVHPFVRSYNAYKDAEHGTYGGDTDILAYLKLRIICAALNEGWEPKFTEDERRYYPWFWLYTKSKLENMPEKEKKGRVIIDTNGYDTEYVGFVSALSDNVPSDAGARVGSRLCFKNSDLAAYCGKRFINLWADYLLRRK